jgi:hypothetical protein
MADPRRFEPDELLIRPGMYFNPQTEILVVVDDSPELEAELFHLDDFEGADWVLISDEVPADEHQRDELLEAFQIRHHPDAMAEITEDEVEDEPDELEEDEPEDEPE